MKTVFKYPLNGDTYDVLRIPKGAKILSIQRQGWSDVLWALVDTEAPEVTRPIWRLGTGWDLDEFADSLGDFIGTTQNASGSLVFHYFEAKRDPA